MATSHTRVIALTAAIVAFTAGGSSISAQRQSASTGDQPAAPGWVFTPAFSVAETWDSNVLLATEGVDTEQDFLTVFTPRGALSYRGRRSTLMFDYQGSYQLYQQLTELNAFDQRSNAAFRHRLTPGITLFARNNFSMSPTTDEIIDLPGVPFRRQGVMMDDARAGLEARVSKRTTVNGAYAYQWIDFDDSDLSLPVGSLSRGGHAHGGNARLEHVLNSRVTVGGEYDIRRGTVDEINDFDIQNTLGTIDWRISQRLQLSAGAGVSWLAANLDEARRAAPAFRGELNGIGARFGWNVGYRRAFLPSYGFGGTFENQEFSAGFISVLSRRIDWSSSLAYRVNDPLVDVDRSLKSLWLRSSISYQMARWMRLEGFYAASLQDSQRAGGKVNRSRFGVQVVTSTRMRVR
jgi:hypothetical protein